MAGGFDSGFSSGFEVGGVTPVYQSVTNVDYTSATTTVAVPVPASVAVGDLLVAHVSVSGGTGVTSLSGWTDVPGIGAMITASNPKSRLQYRIAVGDEGATQTWTIGSTTAHGSMVRITGHHATTPFPVNGTKWDATDVITNYVVPTFTTLVNNCLLLSGSTTNSTTVTFTQPSTQGGAWTEIVDSGQAGGAGKSACMAYQPVAWAAGATGTHTIVNSSARAGQAWMVAVAPAATATVTGTATASMTEADVVAGGKTIIITLNNDTWAAAGGAFDAQRDEIIAGLDSAQSEATGWDLVPKATQGVGGVVRTADTVVTITLDAFATYNITAQETVTVTVPSTAVAGAIALVATPTFTVATSGGVVVGGSLASGRHLVGGGVLSGRLAA